jgi:hypothetical protein
MFLSILVALFLGFTVSFVITPDPTGVFPAVVGIVLTGILSLVFYFGIQRILALNKSSA